MTDTVTTPTEHTIYLGPTKREMFFRAATSVVLFTSIMALLNPNPQDNIPFLLMIAAGFASFEMGLAVHRRNNLTVTFRTNARELVINDKTFKYTDLEVEPSPVYAPSLLMTAGSRKFIPIRPGWNLSNKRVRRWKSEDLAVLTKFISQVGDSQIRDLFTLAWLPLAERATVKNSDTPTGTNTPTSGQSENVS